MNINDNICRPDEIISDTIWELYKLVQCSDIRYIWFYFDKREKLCHIDKVFLGADEVDYAHDSLGDIPCCKNEFVKIELSDIENSKKKEYSHKISVNAFFKCEKTAEELLKEHRLRFASQADIQKSRFEEGETRYDRAKIRIPVNDYPVPVLKEFVIKDKQTVSERFYRYLQRYHIACKMNSDNESPIVSFVIMSDIVPGGFLQGQVNFYESTADVRVSYNSIGADICTNSEYIDELYKLLNYINAHTFDEHRITTETIKGYFTTYTPRIFMDDRDDRNITVSAKVFYKFWSSNYYCMTDDFISEYLPKLLEFLSPYIFGVLQGEMAAEDAIWQIKSLALCELDKMQ